jgi:demethylmenaquinone methyltransferase/2-methoxy-6-polyprenyl-1,4-benzoquinol methylase
MVSSLKLLPYNQYRGVRREYSVIFYYLPIFGQMYHRRVELCLSECKGGDSILEVGFGSGLTFLNLNDMYKKIYGLDLSCDVKQVARVFAPLGIHPDLRNGNVLDMPYQDNHFDTVLLISILEHLKPEELDRALQEIKRVLKPGGQVVYGVPVERPFMVAMFALLGYNIRKYHFSTEKDVAAAASKHFKQVHIQPMKSTPALFGNVYEIGHFIKQG